MQVRFLHIVLLYFYNIFFFLQMQDVSCFLHSIGLLSFVFSLDWPNVYPLITLVFHLFFSHIFLLLLLKSFSYILDIVPFVFYDDNPYFWHSHVLNKDQNGAGVFYNLSLYIYFYSKFATLIFFHPSGTSISQQILLDSNFMSRDWYIFFSSLFKTFIIYNCDPLHMCHKIPVYIWDSLPASLACNLLHIHRIVFHSLFTHFNTC